MKVIKVIEKAVEAEEVVSLDLCNNQEGSTVVSEVYIDLSADNTVVVESSVDGVNWHAQTVVDMGGFKTVEEISEAGYYLIPTAGLAKLSMTFGSAGNVVIKENY